MEVIWRGIGGLSWTRKDSPGVKINATEITENYARCLRSERARFGVSFRLLCPRELRKPQTSMLLPPRARCKGEKLYDVYDLFLSICEALGTERFDLVLLNRAPLSLRFEIVSQGSLLRRDEETLNGFKIDVIRKYQDTPFEDGAGPILKREGTPMVSKEKASTPA